MVRIKVYPETDEEMYFAMKLMKNNILVKIETCYFDEKGKLKVVSGEDSYGIILKSCYKTYIKRDLEKE